MTTPADTLEVATLPVADVPTVRRYLARLARHHRRELTRVLALYGLAVGSGLAGPRLIGELVQGLEDGTTVAFLSGIGVALAAFILLQALLTRTAFRAAGRLAATVQAEVREKFVDDVLVLPLDVVDRSDDGDLVTRASQDVDNLRRALQLAVPQVIEALVWIALTLVALLLTSPLLSLALLVILPPLVVVNRWYLARARDGFLREAAASSGITDGLSATIQGLGTVEAYHLEEHRVRRSRADTESWFEAVRYTLRLRTVLYSVEEFLFTFPVAAALLLGGYAYHQGWADLGAVTAATLYILQLMIPLEALLDWVGTLQQASASLARLLGVQAAQQPTRTGGAPTRRDGAVPGEVVAHGLRFGYDDRPDVLHDVDLTVRPGERLAVVGPTGSGKSTLARLLAGVHPPRSGEVALSGIPVGTLDPADLRRQVVLVSQDQYVFGGSLRDNVDLAGGSPDDVLAPAPDESLHAVLTAVGADEWVRTLPDGLDTALGDGGVEPSDAQAQQIALARLLLMDPKVLILDEATSRMDPGSARSLERSLAAVLKGRTVISIAHRLHTAYDADRIAVVESGRIVEIGSHADLLEREGAYARLWASWS